MSLNLAHRLHYVRQRETADSGLAVVAMLSGVDYLTTRATARRLRIGPSRAAWTPGRGMTTLGLRTLLSEFGLNPAPGFTVLPERLMKHAPPFSVVRIPGVYRTGHLVAYDGLWVYDPALWKPMRPWIWRKAIQSLHLAIKRPASYLTVR